MFAARSSLSKMTRMAVASTRRFASEIDPRGELPPLLVSLLHGNEELRSENKRLREDLQALKSKQVEDLSKLTFDFMTKNAELEVLRSANIELKEQNKLLREEISKREVQMSNMMSRLSKIEAERYFSRVVVALQDLSALKGLEAGNDLQKSKMDIRSLCADRFDDSHYIYTQGRRKDSDEVIHYKLYKLTEVVANLPSGVESRFIKKRYGVLLSEIRSYLNGLALSDNSAVVGSEVVEDVEDWWDV